MKLSDLGEFGLIEKIRKSTFRRSSSVLIGIGDDAAVLKVSASAAWLATTDMLIEGVHFDLGYTDFYSLGWKAAAANLSDIAAMGGFPHFCLTSLGIPPAVTVEHISEFYRGCNALLRVHHTMLVGGDTCSSPHGMIINVVLLGEAGRTRVLSRAGAQPGDRIFVTGTLGDSAAGLELVQLQNAERRLRNKKLRIRNPRSEVARLVKKHLRPVPRVEWGQKIALSRCAHSMIDISDGLSSDLAHICEQSGVGALIAAQKIPVSLSLRKALDRLKKAPLDYALSGGEDYELLFTAPPGKINKLKSLRIPMTEIGEITRTRKILIMDGREKKATLEPTGYNHFPGRSL
ncbi:MAG: thiamine-phosphate kinase [Betaproteobacteria bacterium]